ncbi:MAG TPA: ABC transporter permease [bacterium]|nr:ABC transporter permease [bacterium]
MTEFIRFIGLRYFSQGRKKSTLSLISLISITGLSLGVATLITVLSVMDGLVRKMEQTVLNSTSHSNIYKLLGSFENHEEITKKVLEIEEVTGAGPVVFSEVLISSGKHISGAILNGVDSENYGTVSDVPSLVTEGNFGCLHDEQKCNYEKKDVTHAEKLDDFLGEDEGGLPGIIIGKDLAEKLKVSPGGIVTAVSSKGKRTAGEDAVPVSGSFIVAGIFETGMYDYDSRFAYSNIKDVQKFLQIGSHISFVSMKVKDPSKIDEINRKVMDKAGGFPFAVQDWKEMHKTTFKFLNLQKLIMFIILIFIILVASFGIITTLIMLVISKTREVSVLRSLGAKRSTIAGIFIFDGFIIGLIGTLLGAVLAAVMCIALSRINFPISKEIYFFSTLPVEMSLFSFLSVMVSTIIISIIATLYPSLKATGITPVEGLRYE